MSIQDILALMRQAEVEKAILMSARAIQSDFVRGNAELADAIAPHRSLYGYVYINMHYPEQSFHEMETYLGSDKFVGVKYNGEYSRAAACAVENREVFDLLEKHYRKPLLLHSWGLPEHGNAVAYSLPSQARELALAHPDLKIVMGHMGGPEWMAAIRAALDAPNLYLDTCASYADRDKVGTAARMLGADRVLFGSGATEGNLHMQKGAILDAALSPNERFQVLYGNASRVFGI
jgi:predicted TIM-barrel fold metal-dependent hydrolase